VLPTSIDALSEQHPLEIIEDMQLAVAAPLAMLRPVAIGMANTPLVSLSIGYVLSNQCPAFLTGRIGTNKAGFSR
jgi:hypothetical protein